MQADIGKAIGQKVLQESGFLIVLILVLYLGYDIYNKNTLENKELLLDRLISISVKQQELQTSVNTTNSAILELVSTNAKALQRLEGLENSSIRYVHYSAETATLIIQVQEKSAEPKTFKIKALQ